MTKTRRRKLSKHNVEQMARGYLMYELARRGFTVQITDSRFPKYDMLVVSPRGKHFGIEVKGQSTKSFWRFNDREPKREMYYAFVFVPPADEAKPRIFIMNSRTAMRLWKENKAKANKRGVKRDNLWGINWTAPHPFEKDWHKRLPH
jgi:hypothetical protein